MKPIWLLQVGKTIFAIQFLLFLFYLAAWSVTHETPVVYWDEFAYYLDAVKIFDSFNLDLPGINSLIESLQHPVRPVFSWLAVVLLKLTGGTFNYQLNVAINTILYQLILAFSVFYVLKWLGSSPITIITALSTIWAMPVFCELSLVLMGDVAVAAWIILFTAGILAVKNKSHRLLKTFLLGIIAALGLQTKPIFLMYFVAMIVCLATLKLAEIIFLEGGGYKVAIRQILPVATVLTVTFLSLGYLFYPRGLRGLISELAYNNETLGYWVSQTGIFNSFLWFPTVVFNEISIIPAFILSLTLLSSLIYLLKNNLIGVNKKYGNSIKYLLVTICYSRSSLLFLTFVLLVFYASFLINFKDSRTLFFLLPIFIYLSFYFLERLSHNANPKTEVIYKFLIISILLINLNNTIAWSNQLAKISFPSVNKYLDISNLRFDSENPLLNYNKFATYEKLSILNVLEVIEKDCKPGCTEKNPTSVFIPHSSSRYNESVFESYRYLNHDFNKSFTLSDVDIPFKFFNQIFNYGGWGADGGIPKKLFTAKYIVLVKNYFQGHLSGNAEVYNKLVAKKMSADSPEFIDGLSKLSEIPNQLGDNIIVYKRQKLPSANNFVKIVQTLSESDPNNLWNVPFIYAALEINSQISELWQQLEQMSKLNIAKVKYHYGSHEQEAKTKALLKNPINIKSENVKYPIFLTNW